MSLSGKLEHVAAADVMQFVHLGKRTGTLILTRGDERSEVNFHRGAIVGAWSQTSKKLGELLLEKGLITQDDLDEALAVHGSEEPQRRFGQVLLSRAAVSVEEVRQAVREQIEETIYELVTWSTGSFDFELGTLKPVDDIALYPGDLIPDLDLNTQMVLLEAARIFDERHRGSQGDVPAVETLEVEAAESDDEYEDLGLDVQPTSASPPIHLITDDDDLAETFEAGLNEDGITAIRFRVSDIDNAGRTAGPLAVFDARSPEAVEQLKTSGRWWPRLPMVALVGSLEDATLAYAAGATAAVPIDEIDAARACVNQLMRVKGRADEESEDRLATAGFAKLRRVVSDLRSGVFSVSVALNLMNTIADSVDRAILFLVKADRVVAAGGFGFDDDNRPLAERIRGQEIGLAEEHILSEAVRLGHAISMSFDRARLPESFTDVIGRPESDQVVVFPVMGSDRVILLIYTDNGKLENPIEEIDILDLVAAEVGIAFENEILRRQLLGD